MEDQFPKKKIMKSYRLPVEVVAAIEDAMKKANFTEETAFVEMVLRLALGLDTPALPRTPKVKKTALALTS